MPGGSGGGLEARGAEAGGVAGGGGSPGAGVARDGFGDDGGARPAVADAAPAAAGGQIRPGDGVGGFRVRKMKERGTGAVAGRGLGEPGTDWGVRQPGGGGAPHSWFDPAGGGGKARGSGRIAPGMEPRPRGSGMPGPDAGAALLRAWREDRGALARSLAGRTAAELIRLIEAVLWRDEGPPPLVPAVREAAARAADAGALLRGVLARIVEDRAIDLEESWAHGRSGAG